MEENHDIICLENIIHHFDKKCLYDGINLTINKGEFVYLIGSTGVGKTTLLKFLYADMFPDQGNIWVNDIHINALPKHKIPYLRRDLGIVFQNFSLLENYTVYENVALPLYAAKKTKKMKRKILECLDILGIKDKAKKYPNDMSTGERQRIAIARALVNEPSILLADEPTGNLDPNTSEEIMKVFEYINTQDVTIFLITHNYRLVNMYPHRTYLLENHKLSHIDNLESLHLNKEYI